MPNVTQLEKKKKVKLYVADWDNWRLMKWMNLFMKKKNYIFMGKLNFSLESHALCMVKHYEGDLGSKLILPQQYWPLGSRHFGVLCDLQQQS